MEDLLSAAGADPLRQSWRQPAAGDTVDAANLVVRFGPRRDGGLLVGAHWDSRPWADRDPDPRNRDKGVPGANDGASGTSVLLTLAEILVADPPPIPVTLVLFDLEDMGEDSLGTDYALGSLHFARNWPVDRPEMGLIIDMVCRSGQLYDWEPVSLMRAPQAHRLLLAAERAAGLYLFSGVAGTSLTDDHIPLLAAGLPTALIIGIQDPDWHTLQDLPENCSPDALQQIGTLLIEIIYGGYLR
jgi:hypothetical protein